jgi:acyl-coenzyme A synthetase/AMP-(fatty) acid ligase
MCVPDGEAPVRSLTRPLRGHCFPDPREQPILGTKAFVVLRTPASADELMAWVAERVAGYKRVRQIEFTDRIPRSPAGKILRRLLAGLAD